MEDTQHAKRQRLATRVQRADEDGLEDDDEEERVGAAEGTVDQSTALVAALLKWRRRRQLMREALVPSGMFEDLYGVMDEYLGMMDVNELVCVRTIGSAGKGDGQFQGIRGISVGDRHIAFSDFKADSVSLFDKASGAFIRKFGSYGTGEGQFNGSNGVCLDGGNAFVCESLNNRVQVLTKEGVFVRFIGGARGDGKLNYPIGVSVDEEHVFVSSFYDHCIVLFARASGAFVRKIGSRGSGRLPGQLFHPTDVCLDGGNVYVCETDNNRVYVLTKEGALVRFIGDASGDGQLNRPTGVSVDEQHVFVAQNRRPGCIKVFSKEDGQFIRTVGRSATDGTSAFLPSRLAFSDGELYATDKANHCVAVFEG